MLKQGSICWADVPDRNGHIKRRPIVVLTPTRDILLDQPVVAAAVTTTFQEPLEAACVRLPHDPHGHPATGLRRDCVVRCDWLLALRPSDVVEIKGYVPGRTLLRILETVGRVRGKA